MEGKPVLIARVNVMDEILEQFDTWEDGKHIPELVEAPGLWYCFYYATVTEGLSPGLVSAGNRMALYVGEDDTGLLRWLASKEWAEAVKDGSQFFDKFLPLEGMVFTGNLANQAAEIERPGARVTRRRPALLERWEVRPERLAEFDAWATEQHLPRVVGLPGMVRGYYYHTDRERAPGLYRAPGIRMALFELEDETAIRGTLTSHEFLAALDAEDRWGDAVSFRTRDVYRFLSGHHKVGTPAPR